MKMGLETPPPPPLMEGMRQFVHSNTTLSEVLRGTGKVEGVEDDRNNNNKVNLMNVLEEINDYFLKASECVQEVTKSLEAHKLQYHSNFADNKVPIDHAARVMRVITWSSKGVPHGGKMTEDNETIANVLDKLIAWEKSYMKKLRYYYQLPLAFLELVYFSCLYLFLHCSYLLSSQGCMLFYLSKGQIISCMMVILAKSSKIHFKNMDTKLMLVPGCL